MGLSLATAVSWDPAIPAGFDFLPLVSAITAILLVRFVLGRDLTGWTVAAASAIGTLWAWWVEAAGFAVPSLVALVGLVVAYASPTPRRTR